MKQFDDSPCAFPTNFHHANGIESLMGMTFRQWLAGTVMAQMVANKETTYTEDAIDAVKAADALIAALKAGEK